MDRATDTVTIVPDVRLEADSFWTTYKYPIIAIVVVFVIIAIVTWVYSRRDKSNPASKEETEKNVDQDKSESKSKIAAARKALIERNKSAAATPTTSTTPTTPATPATSTTPATPSTETKPDRERAVTFDLDTKDLPQEKELNSTPTEQLPIDEEVATNIDY